MLVVHADRSVFRDGWFYTGDTAMVSKEGVFTILDRKKVFY